MYMKLIDIIFETVEDRLKWDPIEAKKIIDTYRSVPDFAHDHPKLFYAIKIKNLQKEFLSKLDKHVSYKTGEAVPVRGWGNFDFDTGTKDEKELRIRKFIETSFDPFNKEIGFQIKQFLIRNPFRLVKEMKVKYPNEQIEGPFLEKLKNIILDVASRYTYKMDFYNGEDRLFYLIKMHDKIYSDDEPWMPLVNKIMVPLGNLFKRMNYVFEFPIWENETNEELKGKPTAYVGLTLNEESRKRSHKNSDSSQVYKYMRKTGLEPNFYRLVKNKNGNVVKTTDLNYISAVEAQDLERESLETYQKLGYNTINILKTGGLGGGVGLTRTLMTKLEEFVKSTGTDLSLLNDIRESEKDRGSLRTRLFEYAQQNDLVEKVINRIREILHANQQVKYIHSKPYKPTAIDYYSRGAKTFIIEYEKDYNNEDKKTFRSKLFGQEIMRFQEIKTLDKLNKFLEEPNNFNIDQFQYLTNGSWEQLKKMPDKINIVFDKLKNILEKNNIKRLGEYGNKEEGSLCFYSVATYEFIMRHDKDSSDDKWRNKLFGSVDEYRKMGDLNKNMSKIFNFINGDNSTDNFKNITTNGYSYLKMYNQLHPNENIMTLFFNKLKEIIDTNEIVKYSPNTGLGVGNGKSLGDYSNSVRNVISVHDTDNPNDKWRTKLFSNLKESKLTLMSIL